MPLLPYEDLQKLVARIFQAAGAPGEIAGIVARSLVLSDMAGHESHGVVRVRQYLDSIAAGDLNPQAVPEIVRSTATIHMIDGRRGFGQPAARMAMQTAIDAAREHGLAASALFGCGHVGRLGEWVELAADAGMIGMAWCNGGGRRGAVAPFGGMGRLLGTNPIAAAVPVAGRPPVLIDFATSATAEGKLRVARNRGKSIPEGWILDAAGSPSTDPADFYAGGVLLPAAGHKGYGLALLVELLGGLLTGHGSPALPGFEGGNGTLFLVLDTAAFRPVEDFRADAAALCAQVQATPPLPGFDQVLLPGDPEHRSIAARQVAGVPVDDATWAQLTQAAAELAVAL